MRPSRVYTVEGIILKRKAAGEADRILTVFTKRFGKIRVIAKGVRRITSRRAGHIEVFSRVILTLHAHGTLDIVSEATAVSRGTLFDSDVARMAYAYCMCELVDQLLAEKQEHEEVYSLLMNGFAKIQRSDDPDEWRETLSEFVHMLLWTLGFLRAEHHLPQEKIQGYVERITERKFRAWPLLTSLARPS